MGSHWIPNVRPLCSVADKDVKIRVAAAGTDPKHRTVIATVRPAVLRRLIEIAVAALHEPGIWVHSICRVAGKHVKNRFRLCVGLESNANQDQQDNCNGKAEWYCRCHPDINRFVHTRASLPDLASPAI